MFDIYKKVLSKPEFYRQFRCGDSLVTSFQCLLDNRRDDMWSAHNYFVYVVEGRKIWHTAHGSYDLKKGDSVFVRKGACIIEQFLDTTPCFILFFIPDDFIVQTLKTKANPLTEPVRNVDPVIAVEDNAVLQAFFHSMVPYFDSNRDPDPAILELKFRELVLTLSDNEANSDLRSYFTSLLQRQVAITLQQVMEENYCFNLKLEEFAQLAARSLSAFKRDFQNLYQTTPGKWLMEKRLNHALHLLRQRSKSVAEAAFESGFESASHFSRAFRQRFGASPMLAKRQVTF